MKYDRNASKTYKQLTFDATVCFNAVNFKCSAAEQVMSGTLLERVFFVSCPRLDVTDGNV